MKTLADLQAPRAVEKRGETEAEHQAKCVAWMRARGYWARKVSSMSQRSLPDYQFAKNEQLGFTAKIKFGTEFKRPGTKPKLLKKYGVTVMSTEAQYDEQQAMIEAGWIVFENDNFGAFKKMVFEIEFAHRV